MARSAPTLAAMLSALALAGMLGCQSSGDLLLPAEPGECGRVVFNGNTIELYGIEPIGCDRMEGAVKVALEDTLVSVAAGYCMLSGYGDQARFAGTGCLDPSDQFDPPPSGCVRHVSPDWTVPGAATHGMVPNRNLRGDIVANVSVGVGTRLSENLQIRLIGEGVARASCQVTGPGDTCVRLLRADERRKKRAKD